MNKHDFETLMTSAREALAHAKGEAGKVKTTIVELPELDVGQVRAKTDLPQDVFAAAFGLSLATVRNWEQGRTQPDGAARVLLTLIDRDAEAIMKLLHIAEPKRARAAPRARSPKRKRVAG